MAIIREEISNSKMQQLLAPIAINASKNDIEAIDVSGFDSVLFTVLVGAAAVQLDGEKHVQIALKASNDNVNFDECKAGEILAQVVVNATFADINATPDANTAFMASYIGPKRYVRPVIIAAGDLGDGVIIGISAILHGSKYRPVK